MTRRVNGAVCCSAPTESASPAGVDSNVRSTVRGSSRRVVVAVSVPSRAVRISSRWAGYSWSGALKLPEAPVNVCSACWWQLVGTSAEQWCRTSCQDSADAGRVAPCPFVAEPAKAIDSPTRHVVPVAGAEMTGLGGAPAVTVSETVAVSPALSVTRRRTVYVPAEEYVKDGVALVLSS